MKNLKSNGYMQGKMIEIGGDLMMLQLGLILGYSIKILLF